MKEQGKVRKPFVSGQFYPDEPHVLEHQIKNFLSRASTKSNPDVHALIVPHAGYDYSGQIAAEAYKMIEGRTFDSVVIIAFLHHLFLRGVWVDDVDAYETPLGSVSVDRELVHKIKGFHPLLAHAFAGRLEEHSLEVQIPFLQTVLPGLKIVPVYIGMQDRGTAKALAEGLAEGIKEKNVLVVATTDLSHFYPYQIAVAKDQKVISLFESGNVEAIYEAYQKEEAEACGMGPVLTLLSLAKKMNWRGPSLIRYANSGDVTGERGSVVGYAAMAFQ